VTGVFEERIGYKVSPRRNGDAVAATLFGKAFSAFLSRVGLWQSVGARRKVAPFEVYRGCDRVCPQARDGGVARRRGFPAARTAAEETSAKHQGHEDR
jgi:hypothetical protein